MKKPALILSLALVACAAAFVCVYLVGTASSRAMMKEPQPELAWFKQEFNLGDAEYARVVALHRAYLPQCAARCREIEEHNLRLKELLKQSASVTPEIRKLLLDRAEVRSRCETEMLEHFLAVSRSMPQEQGRRYLAWVEQQTFMRGDPMLQQHQHHGEHGHAH